MKWSPRLKAILGLLLLVATGCGARNGPAPHKVVDDPSRQTGAASSLSIADLRNATYAGIYDTPVRLTDGRFEGQPFQPGAVSRPTLSLLPEPVAFADLNDDGYEEGLVTLVESSGGSGSFVYLAVVMLKDGEGHSLATALIGDRVSVNDLATNGPTIQATVTEPPPGAPMNAPGVSRQRQWELRDGTLVEIIPPTTTDSS